MNVTLGTMFYSFLISCIIILLIDFIVLLIDFIVNGRKSFIFLIIVKRKKTYRYNPFVYVDDKYKHGINMGNNIKHTS